MLFDHCAKCKSCCHVDSDYAPLEVTLTATESKVLSHVCLDGNCEHLGPNGCVLGDQKPFSCQLYPLSFNPTSRQFYFDIACPLMSEYTEQLQSTSSEASVHLAQMTKEIKKLEKIDPAFIRRNHEVDVDFFDLLPLTKPSSRRTKKKNLAKL